MIWFWVTVVGIVAFLALVWALMQAASLGDRQQLRERHRKGKRS